jgi:glutaredoxin
MKSQTIALCLLAAALAVALAAQAQTNVYRWVDPDGKVHFSDAPPPADARDATQRRVGGGGPEDPQLPYATQIAVKRNPVTLYTAKDCGDACGKGRDLLSRRGIPFTERDAQGNPENQEALKKLIGALYVPVLVVGENKLKGYDEDQWSASLDSAGYPRTRLPGQAPLRQEPPAAPAKPSEPASTEPASAEPASK